MIVTTRGSHKSLWVRLNIYLVVMLVAINALQPEERSVIAEPKPSHTTNMVYLPLIFKPAPKQILLGAYTDGYLGYQETIDKEIKAVDTWSGKQMSIVGTFIAFEDVNPDYNIRVPLALIWNSGYTPFVNINTQFTLQDINSGQIDEQITAMALAFKAWHDDGLKINQNRKAFVAPLEEMDGSWVPYHGSPDDFKKAFNRIQSIFTVNGASSAVRWVFAPNGWTNPLDPPFEEYYPGDSVIEVVAFSGYNSGYCETAEWKSWDGPENVFSPYIYRMQVMAPTKPIFLAQIATTAYTQYGYSEQAKNQWLDETYNFLADSSGIVGVIYFNKEINQTCDWSFYQPNGIKYTGYIQGVSRGEYIYMSPEMLAESMP